MPRTTTLPSYYSHSSYHPELLRLGEASSTQIEKLKKELSNYKKNYKKINIRETIREQLDSYLDEIHNSYYKLVKNKKNKTNSQIKEEIIILLKKHINNLINMLNNKNSLGTTNKNNLLRKFTDEYVKHLNSFFEISNKLVIINNTNDTFKHLKKIICLHKSFKTTKNKAEFRQLLEKMSQSLKLSNNNIRDIVKLKPFETFLKKLNKKNTSTILAEMEKCIKSNSKNKQKFKSSQIVDTKNIMKSRYSQYSRKSLYTGGKSTIKYITNPISGRKILKNGRLAKYLKKNKIL